jgi:hypothetical protein
MTRRTLVTGCALAAACGFSAIASFAKPFTLFADVVTAIPIYLMLVAQIVVSIVARRRRASVASNGASVSRDGERDTGSRRGFRPFVPWVVAFAVVIGFELSTFFQLPRQAHPTLSALSDDLTRWQGGQAILFLAWLGLGWLLLSRSRTWLARK